MYAGVPSDVPTWVSVSNGARFRDRVIALAIPKSVTTAVFLLSSTFSR
jgi:hypothetical protein